MMRLLWCVAAFAAFGTGFGLLLFVPKKHDGERTRDIVVTWALCTLCLTIGYGIILPSILLK